MGKGRGRGGGGTHRFRLTDVKVKKILPKMSHIKKV